MEEWAEDGREWEWEEEERVEGREWMWEWEEEGGVDSSAVEDEEEE